MPEAHSRKGRRAGRRAEEAGPGTGHTVLVCYSAALEETWDTVSAPAGPRPPTDTCVLADTTTTEAKSAVAGAPPSAAEGGRHFPPLSTTRSRAGHTSTFDPSATVT